MSKNHVHRLLEKVAASPARIAPERAEALKDLVERHKIELYISDKGDVSFNMGAMFGCVLTPIRTYQHLWSAALVFAALYIERDHMAHFGQWAVDMTHPDIEKVWANYKLSCQCFADGTRFWLPPNAKEITPRTDYIRLADEFFLTMSAFCILHEIAHLVNEDTKTDDQGRPVSPLNSHEMEFAADKWSYQWILDQWDTSSPAPNPKVFIKRSLGVILSLAQMDEFRHHPSDLFASSHPNACDRLLQFFQDYEAKIARNEWRGTCLTATFMALQISAWVNGYVLPTQGFSDPISFLKIAKEEGPKLADKAALRRGSHERDDDGGFQPST